MAEAAAPYSAEIIAAMDKFISESVDHCLASMTPEHMAAGERKMAEMQADPSVMQAAMATVTEDFNASDANQDGILTRDEYLVFVNKMNDRKKASGDWTDEREGVTEQIYDTVANKINTEREGISKEEWDAMVAVWFGKWMPLFETKKAIKAQLEATAVSSYEAWKANATEEQKAVGLEANRKMQEDEEFKNNMMAECVAKFAECDVDNDGLLNRDEYISWVGVMNEINRAKGNWIDERPEIITAYYEACNMITPGADGVTLADVFKGVGIALAKTNVLKAADGL